MILNESKFLSAVILAQEGGWNYLFCWTVHFRGRAWKVTSCVWHVITAPYIVFIITACWHFVYFKSIKQKKYNDWKKHTNIGTSNRRVIWGYIWLYYSKTISLSFSEYEYYICGNVAQHLMVQLHMWIMVCDSIPCKHPHQDQALLIAPQSEWRRTCVTLSNPPGRTQFSSQDTWHFTFDWCLS